MKESIDDRITLRIREVMEQYEPDYSPQAWDKLRKQMPVPVFWLQRVLLNYRYWLSGIALAGILLVTFEVTSEKPSDNTSAIDLVSSEVANNLGSEKPEKLIYAEKRAIIKPGISYNGISRKEKNISSRVSLVRIADSLAAVYQDYIQPENAIAEMHESIEINPVIPVSLKRTGLDCQEDIKQLIPIKYEAEEISASKPSSSDKTEKSKFQWPEINSIFTKEESYDKLVGPNKLVVYYSPEILHSNSLKYLGVSHGIGIGFEGPIRSSVSISAGVSYQVINFHKTVISENVPESPNDTIIESGNYKYLEVPLSINFKFFESTRSQVWLATGISSIVFLTQNYTSETIVGGIISDQVTFSAKGWENIVPLASLNLGLYYRYKFSDRFSLNSEVMYKHHLTKLGYNSTKLNRIGLQVGLVYRFGRED